MLLSGSGADNSAPHGSALFPFPLRCQGGSRAAAGPDGGDGDSSSNFPSGGYAGPSRVLKLSNSRGRRAPASFLVLRELL